MKLSGKMGTENHCGLVYIDNNDIGYARIVREYSVTEQEINNLDSVLKGVCAEASDGCDEGRQKETILKYKEDYRAHVI